MSEERDGLIPGSLAARILDHMRIAGGEFEAGEIAEALQADVGEVRSALGTLRKLCKLTTRLEEGRPLYRIAGEAPGTRIPGSGWKLLNPPAALRAEPAPGVPGTPPVATRETKEPRMTRNASTKEPHAGSIRARILGAVRDSPGLTAPAIAKRLGISADRASATLGQLRNSGRVHATGTKRPFPYEACSEEEALAAGSAHSTKAKRKHDPAAPTVQASAPAKRARNLAEFGLTPTAAAGIAFAMDSHGTLAIDDKRLKPQQIVALVDFLTRTQNVWKAAAAA